MYKSNFEILNKEYFVLIYKLFLNLMDTSQTTLQIWGITNMDSRHKCIINRRTGAYYVKVIVYRISCNYCEESSIYYFALLIILIISIINYQDWHCILVGCSICGKF